MKTSTFEKLYAAVFDQVQKIMQQSSACHDFDHTLRVITHSLFLCEHIDNVDTQIVKMAALLHDVGRPQEYANPDSCCHAATGAIIAYEILTTVGSDETFAKAVAECVRTHRYRDDAEPASLEAKIVYDGDKLDSLGAIGIARSLVFAGSCGARVHNTASEALNSKAYSINDTAYREYLVKLRFLPERMYTQYGRQLGAERLKYMTAFFAELEEESFSG